MRSDQKALSDIYSRIITESSGRKVIEGDVRLNDLHLKELPEWLSDVEIKGGFYCHNNNLTTLASAPKTVGYNFSCHDNKLTTLAGGPKTVRGSFRCYNNKLTTLADGPKTVGGNFRCDNNRLTTLAGAPKTVGGSFYCDGNKLTTLADGPKTVRVDFYCGDNPGNFTKGDVRAVTNVGGGVYV